jgi:hypothetical protein
MPGLVRWFPRLRRVGAFATLAALGFIGAFVALPSSTAAQTAPLLIGAKSRKFHGLAGSFDLPLVLAPADPTTEPRRGPSQTIVLAFDKPVAAATIQVTEGHAIAGAPAFSGSEIIVPLTSVNDRQYVTLSVVAVVASDGGSGGQASVRIGFLAGDVNQNRVVTLADVGQVNGQIAQLVTSTNFLWDVNASGTLSLADKGIANSGLTRALPSPVDASPMVVAITPPNNAVGVASNTDISVQFSEPVLVGGNWFHVACTSGTRSPANATVRGNLGANAGTLITIDPIADFAPGDACTVTLRAAGISDLDADDPPDTPASDYIFSFTVANSGLFEKPHAWSRNVSSLAPSARSATVIAALQSQGGWGNGNRLQTDFSLALLFADSATPRNTISAPPGGYCYSGPDCEPVPLQVPFPVSGNAEGSGGYVCNTANEDCHVLVVERTEKKLYELHNATQTAGGSFTALGAFIWDLTRQYTDVLRGDQCTSADAAGLPIAALLPTADEVAAGEVPHALRFILPNSRMKAGVYVRPATHAGSPSSANADAPPYGVRFRLKASFDEAPFNANARVILRALKKYGMILSDGGNIALTFADDRLSTAKWAALGITSHTFNSIGVGEFEVVDLGAEIDLTYDCVRVP